MTEAAHLIAANPLPPLTRKPGSVGLPADGVEVAVMDANGTLQPSHTLGEVVIRGDNVTVGYDANLEATQAAFCDGWFRTGDQGYRDADGYIVLTGRLKEIINRGGEKVSPREVEEALLTHPAVSQAVAFAMPDARLGEEVAAAVILADGAEAGEKSLREAAARLLAGFKVPRKIVVVEAFPLGPTGKVQRIGLAGRLGLVQGDSGSGRPR
jgi:acyl-CoA synthetase (AMP-forming)/AMP-acid ligase II